MRPTESTLLNVLCPRSNSRKPTAEMSICHDAFRILSSVLVLMLPPVCIVSHLVIVGILGADVPLPPQLDVRFDFLDHRILVCFSCTRSFFRKCSLPLYSPW